MMSRMQEKITRQLPAAYVGIDVGKHQLDVFVHPDGRQIQVANDAKAIRILIRKLKDYDVKLVTLEATSKYHRAAHTMLHEAGIAVAVVNPFRSRQFSDSMGKLAKTDKIDAEMLAHFAERMRPTPTVPEDKQTRHLRDLQAARRQIINEVTDLKRQIQTTENGLVRRQMKARIAMCDRHKAALETEIQMVISTTPSLNERFDILTSIPNIGKITAATLLSDLPELGRLNAKEIAALAGVAPMNWDSGTKHGNRMIRGGRRSVRNALYMCAVGAIARPDPLGRTYRHLVKRGKNPKVALIAVMRKLAIIANTLVAEGRPWSDKPPLNASAG